MPLPFVAVGRKTSGVVAEIAVILYRFRPDGLRRSAKVSAFGQNRPSHLLSLG